MSKHRRVLLFTGEGKGKTTAALGMAARAVGHGMRTLILQFIKSDSTTGEVAAFRGLKGVEIAQGGRGFVPQKSDPRFEDHRESALRTLERARLAVASGDYEMVILDEICTAIDRSLLEEKNVAEMIEQSSGDICIVMTGRGAPQSLVTLADTVTEMRCIKHGFQEGLPAQEGVEF